MSEINDGPALTFTDAVAAIDGKPGNGGWYNGLCPAHNDSTPSLGIKERPDGTFAVKCQAGCGRKDVISALEKKTGKLSSKKNGKGPDPTGLTLERYGLMKRLNPLFLGILYHTGQRTYNGLPAVTFPYYDEDGVCTGVKLRLSESSHDTRWENYEKPSLFGLDVLEILHRENKWDLRRIVICEGESDTQTLVFNNKPALGVSGKKGWKPEFANFAILKDAQEIFVVQEPDAEDFADQVIASFPKGKAHKLILPTKDPSDLWLKSSGVEEFDKTWTQAIVGAYDNSIAFSDTGNAERLVKAYGKNFRWVTDAGVFCVWDGAVWRRDKSGDNLLPQTKDVVRAIADPEWRMTSESAGKRTAMIKMAKGEETVLAKSSLFDTHPMLLNVQNGTLDLATGHFREFRRDDFLTKQAQVAYDPAATCPKFDDFLDFIFNGDQDTVQFMRKALGYTLTGDVGESCFFICYGLGANGKSTLIELMMQMLGADFATPAKFQTFVSARGMHDAKYELANFKGVRLVTAVEPKKAGHLDEEVLKQVTGGDTIKARQIYQEPVDYRPEFKLWLAMNNRPRIIGTDEGIWRRVRMIPFNVRIPEARKVKDYHKLLFATEGPGILNRLLEGVKAWREEGLQSSGAIKRATDEFRAEQNVIQGFFDTYTVSAKVNQHAKAGDLYASYKQWADESNEDPLRQNEFFEELERRGYKRKRTSNDGVHWLGITLKAATGEAEGGAICCEEENV